MKSTLYVVCEQETWNWYVSLDLETDKQYWLTRHREHTVLFWFDPQLSFGQAWQLCKQLSKLEWRGLREDEILARATPYLSKLPSIITQHLTWCRLDRLDTSQALFGKEGKLHAADPEAERVLSLLRGRSLLPEEFVALLESAGTATRESDWKAIAQWAYLTGKIRWKSGVFMGRTRTFSYMKEEVLARCERCGSTQLNWTECSSCETQCPYCEKCLTMGRVRFCLPLLECIDVLPELVASQKFTEEPYHLDHWGLSPAQETAAREGIRFLSEGSVERRRMSKDPSGFLIWAVTGAGKTEITFPFIEYELERGGKVCIATPRRDVVLELQPRIEKAFPGVKVVTLYGGSEQRWEQGDVTIATTHQLLRFWRHFDLVVIDELDAFPFHNNPMLEYAARKSCKEDGRYVLLSATPPAQMQAEVKAGRMPSARVPVRFHRHPLPVPKQLRVKPLYRILNDAAVPPLLSRAIQESMDRGAQLFAFVPAIKLVDPLVTLLRKHFPGYVIQGTSSKDSERARKVSEFRERRIRILVTTTILERGVTVPKSDVLIVDADSALFDEAALVQMAGRAGRAKDDPAGRVYFASYEKTVSQVKAIRQITTMNKLAKKNGFLLPQ